MLGSPRRIAGLCLIGLPGLVLTACGSPTTASPFAVEAERAPSSGWEDTGLPYGGYEDGGETLRLSYRGQSVLLPVTDPAWTEAANPEPGGEPPRLELSTAGATAESGIFQLTPPGGESQLWELAASGQWRQIGSGMTKIALADVTGHLVAWVEDAGENAENRGVTKVAAYDTDAGKIVGQVSGWQFPGNYLWVLAVDGDSVIVHAVQDTADERWTRNYLWKPGTGELTELTDAQPSAMVAVTDYDSGSGRRVLLSSNESSRILGPQGELDIGDYGYAQFNSDATQVIGEGFGFAKVLDLRTNTPIKLDIPLDDHGAFFPGALAWTADDRLAVVGQLADGVQEAYLCTPATGVCDRMGTEYLGFASRENSALGQVAYHDEPEGD